MSRPLTVTFRAGTTGAWQIRSIAAIRGPSLAPAPRLAMDSGAPGPGTATWQLRGVVSNPRYTTAAEMQALSPRSPPLGRPDATRAVLIPLRKSDAWWSLAQDERRHVFEERSRHIARSLPYLPAVARRLHHARDLGEPFDFVTWFEFAPEHEAAFSTLLAELRGSEEWRFVEREVEVRLSRQPD